MATEWAEAGPRNLMEQNLGFRVEVRDGGEAGHVIWFPAQGQRSGVRPATLTEVRLWQALVAATVHSEPGGVPAESVKDPLGTPKTESGESDN